MGSSLPTPASISQDSSILQDRSCPADKSLLTEQDGSPLKLGHIPSNEAEEETGGTLIFATRKPRISKYLKGKEKEWARAVEKRGPLQLLDLPVDVLKEIIKEVTHTNDLTSLALAHSALHNLTIPHIYSRFDIVWPAHTSADPRTGVDALTYGLATLVMGEETFGEVPLQFLKRSSPPLQNFTCKGCGAANQVELSERPVQPRKRRRGNHYAQYTRKFSLGNGPTDWVQEYLITKEGGKMLGTLVALAVARMPNLETFAWDMPTGVLRDVWLALSSLGDRPDGKDCCLERVWVRWHDNGDGSILSGGPPVSNSFPPPHPPPPTGTIMPAGAAPFQMGTDSGPSVAEAYSQSPLALSLSRVERPTFSVLPPLRSLSVLDIDELAYLHEMCVLIGRSQQRLRELRVGIALHAEKRTWVTSPIGEDNQLGGVLGTLMRNVHDMRRKTRLESFDIDENLTSQSACPAVPSGTNQDNAVFRDSTQVGIGLCTNLSEEVIGLAPNGDQVDHCNVVEAPEQSGMTSNVDARAITLSKASENSALLEDADNTVSMESHLATSNPSSAVGPAPEISSSDEIEGIMKPFEHSSPHVSIDKPILAPSARTHLPTALCGSSSRQPPLLGKLELEVLELERVPLATPVVQIAFDWALMTSLTILHCPEHEQLWKSLRRAYSPRHSPTSTTNPRSKTLHSSSRPTSTTSILNIGGSEYRMNLKRIHTDAVSSSLINFLKDTLAPNSIEWLFLQEGRPYTSSVTIDAIYRGPLRRHKASLKKLMIDSSDRTLGGRAALNHRWKKWIFNREVLNFVTSGKMSSLRELGMAVDYRDWHFFLQRLPTMPHLRSLYIPYISNYIHLDPRELALQIVDIIALRPEVDICYIGISSKCFEVLENKHFDERHASHDTSTNAANEGPGGIDPDDHPESDDEDNEEESDEEDEDPNEATAPTPVADPEETESDVSSEVQESEDDENGTEEDKRRPRLRLREILFYDDKVSIFKARHGRL